MVRRGFDWNVYFHKRPRVSVSNAQIAAIFFDALSHAANANANAVGTAFHDFVGNPLAIIAHRPYKLTIVLHESHPCFAGSRMPKNIGYSFLHDTKNGGLHFRRQPRKVGWLHLQEDLDAAAFGESLKVKLKRGL